MRVTLFEAIFESINMANSQWQKLLRCIGLGAMVDYANRPRKR